MDKIANDTKIYTDVQGLAQLRGQMKKDPIGVKKEVAKQFESMLMQMVIRSMRDANKAFSSDLFGNNEMDFYQDIYDKQISMVVSNTDSSIAKMIEKNIDQQQGIVQIEQKYEAQTILPATQIPKQNITITTNTPPPQPSTLKNDRPSTSLKEIFGTKEEFVTSIWSSAKEAAVMIGVDPQILVAQAALETNWGKNILPDNENNSSHNLFNIKADSRSSSKTKPIEILEQKNGVLVKEKSTFKTYGSFIHSFMDYVGLLKNNDRYTEALSQSNNPNAFVHALQKAGYATDTHYADKILSIFSSHSFRNLMMKMK